MICVYSHIVTQYAGYKVVSKRNSNHATQKNHIRSARRLTTASLKTFSSPWRFSSRSNAQLGCRLGNNVSLVSTLQRLHQCRDPVLRNPQCAKSRAVGGCEILHQLIGGLSSLSHYFQGFNHPMVQGGAGILPTISLDQRSNVEKESS